MERGNHPYGLITDGALVTTENKIAWVGPRDALPSAYKGTTLVDLDDFLITPALIDCHTHLIYGGTRAREFEMRLQGISYQDIARAGGGIMSTVRATRAASEDDLIQSTLPRLDTLLAEGICLVEIKSGYGLGIEAELKMLRTARKLATLRSVRIVTSWLAAHIIPPAYTGKSDTYIDEVVIAGLQTAHAEGLVDYVDAYCETIAFSPAQTARIFDAADTMGIPKRLHAEQFTHLGGAKLAAHYGALSADHLEYLPPEDTHTLAKSSTVAVLLPGAFYSLQQQQVPPVQALREAAVPMAVATDANPGSSPLFSILTAMNMACTLFGLTPEEALAGTTIEAARALGLQNSCGTLSIGKRADLAIWDVDHPTELAYHIGINPLKMRILGGRHVH